MTKWECFHDPAYYDMWCVRKVGESDFNKTIHVVTKSEAEYLTNFLNGEEETDEV